MSEYLHDIERYHKGEMTPAEMHALEKKALHDPFLADALEGLGELSPAVRASDLDTLKARLANRTAPAKNNTSLWSWPLKIAAGLAMLAISTFILITSIDRNKKTPSKDLALNKPQSSKNEEPRSQAPLLDSAETTPNESTKEPEVEETKRVTESNEDNTLFDKPALSPRTQPTDEPPPVSGQTASPVEKEEEQSLNTLTESAPKKDDITTEPSELINEKRKANRASAKASPSVAADQALSSQAALDFNRTIKGKITSADDLELPGVNVVIKGTNIGTVTDGEGNFELAVNTVRPSLVFSFIGFETKEIQAGTLTEVNVKLAEDVSQLSEIVIEGYEGDSIYDIPTVEFATPAGGRVAYKRYLERSITYPQVALENEIEGKVTIQFTVEKTGQLADFKIVRGLGFGCDEEVIRLIKEGPEWSPTKRNNEPITGKVKVRMRFKLPKK